MTEDTPTHAVVDYSRELSTIHSFYTSHAFVNQRWAATDRAYEVAGPVWEPATRKETVSQQERGDAERCAMAGDTQVSKPPDSTDQART